VIWFTPKKEPGFVASECEVIKRNRFGTAKMMRIGIGRKPISQEHSSDFFRIFSKNY